MVLVPGNLQAFGPSTSSNLKWIAILSRARELGINFIDTAECYGYDHLSETFIGNSIVEHRDQWIIATKFGHNHGNDLGNGNYQPAQVLIQLEESLRALQHGLYRRLPTALRRRCSL